MADPREPIEELDGPEDDSVQEDQGQAEANQDDGSLSASEEGASEAETDEASEDGEGQVEEPARRPSRAQSRIQSLTQTVQQEKAERQRIERELQELRAEARARQQQSREESPEAKAARRALMDPMEVMREDLRESEQRTQQLLHQQAVQTQETQDKLLYNSILRDAPHLRKYEAEVEKIRLEQVARGTFVPREVLLDLAIGRAARAQAMKAAPKAQKDGQRKVAQQQSRPAAARGDTATQRGRQGDSVEKRLENVPI